MHLRDLLLEHSQHVGVPLSLDQDGVCHLVINEEHIVNIEIGDSENFFFYSEVTRLPEIGNESVFKMLLKANLYGKRTQGMTFALDDHGTQVILFKELLNQYTDFHLYSSTLQNFVDQIVFWKTELAKGTPPPPEASKGREPPPGQWIKL